MKFWIYIISKFIMDFFLLKSHLGIWFIIIMINVIWIW
jgi:hypothetical protein